MLHRCAKTREPDAFQYPISSATKCQFTACAATHGASSSAKSSTDAAPNAQVSRMVPTPTTVSAGSRRRARRPQNAVRPIRPWLAASRRSRPVIKKPDSTKKR